MRFRVCCRITSEVEKCCLKYKADALAGAFVFQTIQQMSSCKPYQWHFDPILGSQLILQHFFTSYFKCISIHVYLLTSVLVSDIYKDILAYGLWMHFFFYYLILTELYDTWDEVIGVIIKPGDWIVKKRKCQWK